MVDLTHGVAPFDVRAGALALSRSVAYSRSRSGHGRGRPRRGERPAGRGRVGAGGRRSCGDAGPGTLVGPDNGLLGWALDVARRGRPAPWPCPARRRGRGTTRPSTAGTLRPRWPPGCGRGAARRRRDADRPGQPGPAARSPMVVTPADRRRDRGRGAVGRPFGNVQLAAAARGRRWPGSATAARSSARRTATRRARRGRRRSPSSRSRRAVGRDGRRQRAARPGVRPAAGRYRARRASRVTS